MLETCLLGTGGMMPLPYRWLTSLMVRYNGMSILIDAGEGTQIAMKKKGWSPKPIDVICFTHFHADHISGLPGLLLSMGNAERETPLLLIGPKGLARLKLYSMNFPTRRSRSVSRIFRSLRRSGRKTLHRSAIFT